MTNACSSAGQCVGARDAECVPKNGCEEGYVCAAFPTDLKKPAACHAVGTSAGFDGEYCLDDEDCASHGFCLSGVCNDEKAKYAGDSCTESSECVDATAGCYQGKCQCHKSNAWGCPLGTACSGGNHAIYGRECQ